MVDIYSLIFKSIQSDLTKSGQSISIFGKEWRNVVNDIRNAKGLGNKISAAFSTGLSDNDISRLKEYNNLINKGQNPQTAYYRTLKNASAAAQDLAMKANGAAVSEEALTAATNKLTISQRIATVASKAMGVALQVALNVGVALAINGIITLIDYLVNREQKAIEAANDLGKAYKDQKDKLVDLKQEYLDIVDSSKSETEKTKDLYEWKKKLIKAYGYEKDAIEGVTTARATGLKFFDEEEQKDAQELINKTLDEYEKAYKKVYGNNVGSQTGSANGILSPDALDWLKEYKNIIAEISDIDVENSDTELSFYFGDNIYDAIAHINEVLTGLNTLENNGVELTYVQKEIKRLFKSYLDEYEKAKTEAETILSETGSALLTDQFVEFLKIDENKLDKVTFNNFNEWKSKFVKYLEENAKELLKDANFVKIMDEYFSNLKFELFPNEMTTQTNKYGYSLSSLSDKFAELKDVINDASKNQATIQSTLEKIRQGTSLTTDEMNKVAEAYPDLLGKFRQTVDGWTIGADELVVANEKVTQSAKDAIDEQIKILGETSEKIKAQLSQMPVINSKSDYEAWQKRKEQLNGDLTDIEKQLKGLDNLSETLTLNLTNRVGEFSKATAALSSKMKTLSSAFKEQKENGSLSVDTVLTLIENGYSAALMYDKQTGQIKLNADAYLELARAEIEKQKADILIAQNEALTDKLDTERSITSNLGWAYLGTAEAMLKMKEAEARLADDEELIKALQEQYDVLSTLGDQLGTVVTGDYGGSKSGSSSDPTKEAFEKEMKDIEHLHNMGLASDEEYYDALEKANERHYKNSVDHESDYLSNIEKIYKARQLLYKDDADKQFTKLDDDFKEGRITAEEYTKSLYDLGQSLYGKDSPYANTEFATKALEELDKKIKGITDDIYSERLDALKKANNGTIAAEEKFVKDWTALNDDLYKDNPKEWEKNYNEIANYTKDYYKKLLDDGVLNVEQYKIKIKEFFFKLNALGVDLGRSWLADALNVDSEDYDEFKKKLTSDGDADLNNVIDDVNNLAEKNIHLFADTPETLKKNGEELFNSLTKSAQDALSKGLISPERYLEIIDTFADTWQEKLGLTQGIIDEAKNALEVDDWMDDWDRERNFDEDKNKYDFGLRQDRIDEYHKKIIETYGVDGVKNVKAYTEALKNVDKEQQQLNEDIYSKKKETLSVDGDRTLDNVLKDAKELSEMNVELFSGDSESFKENANDIFGSVKDVAKDSLDKMLITPDEYLNVIQKWGEKLNIAEGILEEAKEISESDYFDRWDLDNGYDSKKSKDDFELRSKRAKYIFELAEKLYGKNGQKNLKAYNALINQGYEDVQSLVEDYYDKEIEKLEKIKDEEEKRNKAIELRLNLIKSQQKLEDAKRNRNQLIFNNGTFEYVADQEAVMSAQEDVEEAKKAILEQATEDAVNALKEQKNEAIKFFDTVGGKITDVLDRLKKFLAGDKNAFKEYGKDKSDTKSKSNDNNNTEISDIVKGTFDVAKFLADGADFASAILALGGKPTIEGMKNFMDSFNATLVGKQIEPSSVAGITNNSSTTNNNNQKVEFTGDINVNIELTVESLDDFVNNKIDDALLEVGRYIKQKMPAILAKA